MTDELPADRDQAYLAAYDFESYARPSVAVDVVLLAAGRSVGDGLRLMLVQRTAPPQQGLFALPGGFVGLAEPLGMAAERVLAEKTGLRDIFCEQLATFGAPERDPRGRVISIAFWALVSGGALAVVGKPPMPARAARVSLPAGHELFGPLLVVDDDGQELPLAFDHASMIRSAITRLRRRIWYTPVAFELMPDEFTLASLRDVYQTVLGRPLNKDSFRKRILGAGTVEPTDHLESSVGHRPARLYRFARRSEL